MIGSAVRQRAHDAAPSRVLVTVVESEACHFCIDAHHVLADLAIDFPLVVETVDIRSEAGGQLMARHRAAMSPLVLIDGAFFSSGRLPRRKLVRMLSQRFGVPAAVRSSRSGGTHG